MDSPIVPSNSVSPDPFFKSAGIFFQIDASLRSSILFSRANDSPQFFALPFICISIRSATLKWNLSRSKFPSCRFFRVIDSRVTSSRLISSWFMSVIFVFCDRRIRDKDLLCICSENRDSTFPACSFSMAFMFLNETSPSNWPLRKSSDRKSPFRWVSKLKSAKESASCAECKLPNLICESSFTGKVLKSDFRL